MRFFWYALLGLAILLGDFFSKLWILSLPEKSYIVNYGVSWGVGSRGLVSGVFFGLLALVVALLFAYSAWRRYREQKNIFPEVLLVGGATANILDRLLHGGGVVDFIDLASWGISFPVFNIADIAVVTGVFLLLLREWIYETV